MPTFPSRTSALSQKESFLRFPSPLADLAPSLHCGPLSSSLSASCHDRWYQGLCLSSGDDINCFRLVGSDICSEELERYILMANNLLPPSLALSLFQPYAEQLGGDSIKYAFVTFLLVD